MKILFARWGSAHADDEAASSDDVANPAFGAVQSLAAEDGVLGTPAGVLHLRRFSDGGMLNVHGHFVVSDGVFAEVSSSLWFRSCPERHSPRPPERQPSSSGVVQAHATADWKKPLRGRLPSDHRFPTQWVGQNNILNTRATPFVKNSKQDSKKSK